MSIKKNLDVISDITKKMNAIKVAKNTFSTSRKRFYKTNGQKFPYSTKLFQGAILQLTGRADVAKNTVDNLSHARMGSDKALKKFRKYMGIQTQQEFKPIKKAIALNAYGKKGLDADRMVNARAKGIKFIRKNGRIIPIRPKKGN